MCAGSNPAGGTSLEVPKDLATSVSAEGGVFLFPRSWAAKARPWRVVRPVHAAELEAPGPIGARGRGGPRNVPGAWDSQLGRTGLTGWWPPLSLLVPPQASKRTGNESRP
ncbi:hypothetical protein GCM10009864_27400 [Streptomyces lunalinharesii]|uniref:Uncharacterized protein n=1 Tax=Streptomyces lunalinharesii TaxID=333384 RepID=A0ABN3RRT2_9ACTN